MKELDGAIEKALNWMVTNRVKTYNWQAQFEDIETHLFIKT